MTIEQKLHKVLYPADPQRCQANIRHGQCPFRSEKDMIYCPMHKARAGMNKEEEDTRIYRLSKWQGRVNQIADNDKVKSLREEIGIARVVMEEIVNKCQDSETLLLYSSKIADMLSRIEKLVASCHRLEQSTGFLLDKTSAVNLALKIVQIISDYIPDETLIEQISNDIVNSILLEQPARQQLLSNGAD